MHQKTTKPTTPIRYAATIFPPFPRARMSLFQLDRPFRQGSSMAVPVLSSNPPFTAAWCRGHTHTHAHAWMSMPKHCVYVVNAVVVVVVMGCPLHFDLELCGSDSQSMLCWVCACACECACECTCRYVCGCIQKQTKSAWPIRRHGCLWYLLMSQHVGSSLFFVLFPFSVSFFRTLPITINTPLPWSQ